MDNGFEQWALESAERGEETPRFVGEYSGTLCSVPFSADISPYVSWKIQRLRDLDAAINIKTQNLG